MWKDLWSEVPAAENPITYITNGVHTLTWLAYEWIELFNEYLSDDWQERIQYQEVWKGIEDIPNDEVWNVHQKLKSKMIDHIKQIDTRRGNRYNGEFKDRNLVSKDILTI
jgi:starch phosphorylase